MAVDLTGSGKAEKYAAKLRVKNKQEELRDWFAGMALQGHMFNEGTEPSRSHEDLVRASYEIADAMLKERSK